MKRIKRLIMNWVRVKRFNVFMLFLLMSLMISIVIKLSNKASYTLRLELVPIHDNFKEVLLHTEPKFIDVTLKSNGFGVLKFALSELKLLTDFNTLQKTESTYFWNAVDQRMFVSKFFDPTIDIIDISPQQITFEFDEQSAKSLPVRIRSALSFAVGYDMDEPLRSSPDSVVVVGSKQSLDLIDEIYTSRLVKDNLNSDINESLTLLIPEDLVGLNFTQKEIKVFGKVEKFTEGVVRVPVQLLNVPENQYVSIFPKEVPVVFYSNLDIYNAISAEDFRVECDFNSLNATNDLLIPKLVTYPNTVKRVALQLNQIEYVIKSKND